MFSTNWNTVWIQKIPRNEICNPPFTNVHKGSIPHLTKEVQRMTGVNIKQQILSISLPTIISMKEILKQYNSFLEFVNMQEHLTFLSIQDPSELTNKGFQQTESIAVWSRHGRHSLTAEEYMEIVDIIKPDIYLALCDGDTDRDSTGKRAQKSVRRSQYLLEKCLEKHNNSETLKFSGILGAVEGGYEIIEREKCIKYLKNKDLLGYVIDGLHRNGPETAAIKYEEINKIMQHTINMLPKEKLRVTMGCWNPIVVLDLIGLGVDVFDSSYAFLITEQLKAFTFQYESNNLHQIDETLPEISLNDKRYAEDFSPISPNCICLTCKNHTKAYIHHLCQAKELLAQVLLMIHNTHHYIQFFEAIRTNLTNGTFPEFRKTIQIQFESQITS
ncbi:queuine tRNA-ribosyltransferase accessory subunit 2 isoform X2 [Leptopilina heterotoma]|uniref:queuine tRNA-ribosyltransferase accessory subunit 2 isoform X2 n=1 Tax=Leptopilina heterotoma TaxID=63436 RepID=UPI001CAA0957|nr:queuine tRNA-ribosyltransferase accessory subunit 2 isoform X2 [Leptopilina heterotoma]